ncbi:MAG: alpha/beta fold hydrolase [Pseudomonadota bacterium]
MKPTRCSYWLAAILILLGHVCTSGTALAMQTLKSEPRWIDCPFEVSSRVKCGEIDALENRDHPNGKQVTLRFAVISAHRKQAEAAPIAYLTGGPGFSAFTMLKLLPELSISKDQDVIVLEPRGYGYSEPALLCPSKAELKSCHKRFVDNGIDVSQYTTEASVEDYEELRRSLGVDRWNLLGVSYGTYWASLYLRMYPDSIRSVIMDSPYPLNASYRWNRVAFLNAFDLMADSCKADVSCNEVYPDLRARFITAMRRLKNEPATFENETLDHVTTFGHLFETIYLTNTLKLTPRIVDALAREDYAEFLSLAGRPFMDLPRGIASDRLMATGLNASVMCQEDIYQPASLETRVAASSPWPPDIVDMITPEGWDYDERCKAWSVPIMEGSITKPVVSDIPVLVSVGAFDPVTPQPFAEAMMLHLSNSKLALGRVASHGLLLDPDDECIQTIYANFIANPDMHADTSCLMAKWPVPWDVR